jgi:hypothetical protein
MIIAMCAMTGCRLGFNSISDGGHDDGSGADDGNGAMHARVVERLETTPVTIVTSSPMMITPGSTVVVVLWGSSNTKNATAGDPVAGSYVADPILTTASAFSTQNGWIVQNHPGGAIAITVQWPMAQAVSMWVIEIENALPTGAIDAVAAHQSTTVGPEFLSPEVVTSRSNDLLLALEMTDANAGEVVTFTSGETILGSTVDPTAYPGVVGLRRLGAAGPYQSTTTHAVGTQSLMSLIALAEP